MRGGRNAEASDRHSEGEESALPLAEGDKAGGDQGQHLCFKNEELHEAGGASARSQQQQLLGPVGIQLQIKLFGLPAADAGFPSEKVGGIGKGRGSGPHSAACGGEGAVSLSHRPTPGAKVLQGAADTHCVAGSQSEGGISRAEVPKANPTAAPSRARVVPSSAPGLTNLAKKVVVLKGRCQGKQESRAAKRLRRKARRARKTDWRKPVVSKKETYIPCATREEKAAAPWRQQQ